MAAAVRVVRKALRRVTGAGTVQFFDDRRMRLAERVSRWLAALGWPRLQTRMTKLRVLYDLLRGKPSSACLEGTRWRVRPTAQAPRTTDPLDNNAGLMWLSPVLPMKREHVDRLLELAQPIFARFGFEFQVTLSSVTARALCGVMTIAYDRADRSETERARACYEEVLETVLAAGYVPYRMGNVSMDKLAAGSEVFWEVVADLKSTLDPQGLFSPGHYEPKRGRLPRSMR